MQQPPRQFRELPTRLADKIGTIAGIPNLPDQRKQFSKYLSFTVRAAWRGHAVPHRKVPRQSDVTGRLNTLLSDLNKLRGDLSALLPEGPDEVVGAFLGATMLPDTVEAWIDSIDV